MAWRGREIILPGKCWTDQVYEVGIQVSEKETAETTFLLNGMNCHKTHFFDSYVYTPYSTAFSDSLKEHRRTYIFSFLLYAVTKHTLYIFPGNRFIRLPEDFTPYSTVFTDSHHFHIHIILLFRCGLFDFGGKRIYALVLDLSYMTNAWFISVNHESHKLNSYNHVFHPWFCCGS